MLRSVVLALAALLAFGHPAAAQDKPNLTVYTYDSFAAEWGPGPALKTGFEAICGCTLTYVAAEDAISAYRRVQLEGATTKADIVMGLEPELEPLRRKWLIVDQNGPDGHQSSSPLW